MVPRSTATTAYELLDEVVAVVEADARRIEMAQYLTSPITVLPEQRPPCGTIACIAGWMVVLRDGRDKAYGPLHGWIPERALRLLESIPPVEVMKLFVGSVWVPGSEYSEEGKVYLETEDPRCISAVIVRIRAFQETWEQELKAIDLATRPDADAFLLEIERANAVFDEHGSI
jgi:hypothetical protein